MSSPANTHLLAKTEMARVSSRMAAIATVALLGACAIIAVMMFTGPATQVVELQGLGLKTSDLSLLQKAIHAQDKEKHRACLAECTTSKCKTACGTIHKSDALKKAIALNKKVATHKKKSKAITSDQKLLNDAIKGQHSDEVKHCEACVSKECKLNCKKILAAKEQALLHPKKAVLGLKQGDLTLLQDAEARQAKETAKGMYMHKQDLAALKHKHSRNAKIDLLNHQPADDGDGDWSPGMRKNALSQLKDEEEQAKQTAKIAHANDADDSWSH